MNKVQREKILKSIDGVKQERDLSILEYQAMNPQKTYREIKEFLNLDIAEVTIGAIVANNWDKVLRIFALSNLIAGPEGRDFERARAYYKKMEKNIESRKDPLDILNDMEDNAPVIDNSKHIHNTYNVEGKTTAELADILNKRLRPIKV